MENDIIYDITPVLGRKNIKVIFVNTAKASSQIKDAILHADEKYRFTTNKVFLRRKLGGEWVRNKKKIRGILKRTLTVKSEGEDVLEDYAEQMDLAGYLDRRPIALSSGQMERVSLLYEALNHERRAMIYNDCYYVDTDTEQKDKSNIIDAVKLILSMDYYKFLGFDLIWITDLRPKEFFGQVGEIAYNAEWFTYYRAYCRWGDIKGKLVLQDVKEMRRRLENGEDVDNCPAEPEPEKSEQQTELDPNAACLRVLKVERGASGSWAVYGAEEKGSISTMLYHYQSQRTGMRYHCEAGGDIMLALMYKYMSVDTSFILDYYREHTEYHSDPRVQEILRGTRDFDRGPVIFRSGSFLPYRGEYDWKTNRGDPDLCDLRVGDRLIQLPNKR